jgi:hypothetical protein
MSSVELKMQSTIHFQRERGYFKKRIVLKWNYDSMMVLLPIILFLTNDIYEKVNIRRWENRHDPDLGM